MKPKNIVAFFSTLLMVSCLSAPSQVPTQTARSIITVLPASTTLPPKPPQFLTSTPISSSEDCGSQNILSRTNTVGKIVFYEKKGLYFYDPQNNQDSPPFDTTDITLYLESSPDRKQIAVFNPPTGLGEIITSDGHKSIVNTKNVNGIFYGWLDNQKIVFVDRAHSDGSVIIFDTETGKTEEKVTHLTDVNFDPIYWYADSSQPSVIFDSSLRRIIYTSMEFPPPDQARSVFILRDYNTKNILWSKQSIDITVKPKWSPDGKYVAVVITNEDSDQIYILTREGKEAQVIDTNTFGIDQIEWSPNSEQISISEDKTLTIFDPASKQKHEFTLPQNIYGIIWSPTGNQIAVRGALIDLSTNCLVTLKPENPNGPLAWLVDK